MKEGESCVSLLKGDSCLDSCVEVIYGEIDLRDLNVGVLRYPFPNCQLLEGFSRLCKREPMLS